MVGWYNFKFVRGLHHNRVRGLYLVQFARFVAVWCRLGFRFLLSHWTRLDLVCVRFWFWDVVKLLVWLRVWCLFSIHWDARSLNLHLCYNLCFLRSSCFPEGF